MVFMGLSNFQSVVQHAHHVQLVKAHAVHHDGVGQQAPGAEPSLLVQAHDMRVGGGDRQHQLGQPGHAAGGLYAGDYQLLADALALGLWRNHHAYQRSEVPLLGALLALTAQAADQLACGIEGTEEELTRLRRAKTRHVLAGIAAHRGFVVGRERIRRGAQRLVAKGFVGHSVRCDQRADQHCTGDRRRMRVHRSGACQACGALALSSACSSASVLALKKALGSSPGWSNGTMAQRCCAVHASILRPPAWVKATRLSSRSTRSRQNTGWVRTVVRPVPSSSGAAAMAMSASWASAAAARRWARSRGNSRVGRARGRPRKFCRPLSTPPMREPRPPARTMPVMSWVSILVMVRAMEREIEGYRSGRVRSAVNCRQERTAVPTSRPRDTGCTKASCPRAKNSPWITTVKAPRQGMSL